jgi:membrane-associated protease RseP (regulator of RpoE activity)
VSAIERFDRSLIPVRKEIRMPFAVRGTIRWVALGLLIPAAFAVTGRAQSDKPADGTKPKQAQPADEVRTQQDAFELRNRTLQMLTTQANYANQLNWIYALQGNADPNGLGVELGEADRSLRVQLSLPDDRGLVLRSVNPGGPAAAAGLLENDILLTLDDKPLGKPEDLELRLKEAGDKALGLAILRTGKPLKIAIKPVYRVTFTGVADHPTKYFIGVPVKPIDSTLRAHLPELPANQGLVAESIIDDSPAAKAGLKPDDILLAVGDKPITDTETLIAQVQASGGKPTQVKILRGGKPMTLEVTPAPRKDAPEEGQAVEAALRDLAVANSLQNLQVQPIVTGNLVAADQNLQNVWVPYVLHQNQGALQLAAAEGPTVEKRLEAMAQEIKQLRESVEALRHALKK